MTIFFEIAKIIMRKKVEAIIHSSIVADQSTTNTTLTWFGHGRDSQLSADKRSSLTGLLPKIDSLAEGVNDLSSLKQLQALVGTCIYELKSIRLQHNHERGSSEPELESLNTLLDAVFRKIQTLQFIDLPHDRNPLNSFRYSIALYCAQKIVDSHNLSQIAQLLSSLSNQVKFDKEQEQIAVAAVDVCASDVSALDKRHPSYDIAFKRFVTLHIESLVHENERLNARYAHLPAFLSSQSCFLHKCLTEAMEEIGIAKSDVTPTKSAAAASAQPEPLTSSAVSTPQPVQPAESGALATSPKSPVSAIGLMSSAQPCKGASNDGGQQTTLTALS